MRIQNIINIIAAGFATGLNIKYGCFSFSGIEKTRYFFEQ